MATVEKNGLLTYKDKAGNKHLLYPITKSECVYGLDDALNGVNEALSAHVNNKNNPHGVTPGQIGALPTTGGTMTGNIIMSNGSTVTGLPDPEEREDAVSFGYLKRRYGMGVTTFQNLIQGGVF